LFMIRNRMAAVIACTIVLLLATACAVLEAGIERAATGSARREVNWQATAEALQAEATRNSQVSQPTVVAPTLVPTTVPPIRKAAMVAYVQGGDIWVKSLPDGEARRLTQDGRNAEPRWSATGEWLSFLKNSNLPQLWLVHYEGGEAQQLGTNVGPDSYAWSPIQDKIAYGIGGSIQVYALDDAGETELVNEVQIGPGDGTLTVGKIAWSPNGQQLAFTISSQWTDGDDLSGENDGLWVVDLASNTPEMIVASEVPDKGEIILQGWSGDGKYLLYWQGPILSASILADGVPLYRVPAAGGTPEVIAEWVLPREDLVQSQPNGLPQVAIVEGSGREMWHDKRLRAVLLDGLQGWDLSPEDQAVSSPVWSPSGGAIAYIGMPAVDDVSGGPEAQDALNARQVWIIESGQEARPIHEEISYREEAPQWIDDENLLVVRMDADDHISLWQVSISGGDAQQVVDEITPAPEWFGYYGHIRWQEYFSLWRPHFVEPQETTMALTPTVVPPSSASGSRTLAAFLLGLHPNLTSKEAVATWGEPDELLGSGLLIYQYILSDGVRVWLAFPGDDPLVYARLVGVDGRIFELSLSAEHGEPSEPPVTATATPVSVTGATPASMPGATPTATPLSTIVPPTTPTPTPATMEAATAVPGAEPTATPLLTVEPPANVTPVDMDGATPTATPIP
jgi:Tol biopolymer transport system component